MKAKLVKESLIAERKNSNIVKTTVDELFTWYVGDENWEDDTYAEICNVMSIDGDHAQDDGADGQNSISFFVKHKNDPITVESINEYPNGYDLEFNVGGKHVSMQSINPALESSDEDEDFEFNSSNYRK